MAFTLGMIHTLHTLPGLFESLAQELVPETRRIHHVDEAALQTALANAGLTPFVYRAVCSDVVCLADGGAELIVLTCSSLSPCVDVAETLVSVPVLKIDQPMMDRALNTARRIGVAATAPTTMRPTTDLLRARSAALGKPVEVVEGFCDGAYSKLQSGALDEHDRIVRASVLELADHCELIVLAQASMARVVDTIDPHALAVPVLSSPRIGMEHIRDLVQRV